MATSPNTTYGDASQIRFAPLGHIYVANANDVKDDLPTDVTSDLVATGKYSDLGYVDPNGVTITPSMEVEPVNVWQSAVAVLQHVKGASFKMKATMMQTSRPTTELFFGATWKEQTVGPKKIYRLDLKSTPDLREFCAVVDWTQTVDMKDINYRCVIPRSMLSERGSIMLQRTESSKFEMTWDALDLSGMLGFVLTDDKAMGTTPSVNKPPAPGGGDPGGTGVPGAVPGGVPGGGGELQNNAAGGGSQPGQGAGGGTGPGQAGDTS